MKRYIFLGIIIPLLGACNPAMVAMVAGTALTTYCASTTEDGKQAIRDKATGGKQILACNQ